MFSRRRNYNTATTTTTGTHTRRGGLFHRRNPERRSEGLGTTTRRGGLFHRRNPERRAAGLKGALANPNTTATGRRRAKHELHEMGHSAHVPLSVKIKRTLGIRSTPRRQRREQRAEYAY